MNIADINGNIRKWNRVSKEESKSKIVKDMNKYNSELALSLLSDFESGINTTSRGKRTPSSLLRVRQAFRLLSIEAKNKPLDKLTDKQLTLICDKKNSEHFVKNIKAIYSWMYRTNRIKENIAKHLVPNDYSSGKPAWVFLTEQQMKTLINASSSDYRALISFLFDSGIRPSEAWKIRILDFSDDYKVLNILEKRKNGERVSKTFERTIKLKLCSGLIKEYIKVNKLEDEDLLFRITQAGFNKTLKRLAKRLFGKKVIKNGKTKIVCETTKGREKICNITATDIRHNSACFWLIRYKTHRDLMYRIDDDLITTEDKSRLEKDIADMKKENANIKKQNMYIKKMFGKILKESFDELETELTSDNFLEKIGMKQKHPS